MDEVFSLPKALSLNIEEIRRDNPEIEDFVTDLYTQLRPSLISYVYHLMGSTRDAEDVVQIAFIQLFDQLNADVEIKNIRGWLYKVAHNLAIGEARRYGRREVLFRQWLAGYEPDSSSVEEDLMRREQIELTLRLLNEREQRCLMLRAEGLTYQEIADVVDTTPKSVSVYLARGLKKFRSRHEDK